MASGDFRSSRRFQEMARLLRTEILARGVELAEGAAEELLAEQIVTIAPKAGLTEDQLTSVLSPGMITALADEARRTADSYLEAVADTEPVSLSVANAGRILSGMGYVLKLAFRHAEATRIDSMDTVASAADALPVLGTGIEKAVESGASSFSFGGLELVKTRKVLAGAIDRIRAGEWECPAGPHDEGHASCPLTGMLSFELEFLGAWPNPPAGETGETGETGEA